MKKWAKVVAGKGVFLQRDDFTPPEGATEYMEYEDTPAPAWNKATQKLDGPVFAVVDKVLTKAYTVTDKTQDELDVELAGMKSKRVQRLQRCHDSFVTAGLQTDVVVGDDPFKAKIDSESVSMWQLAKGFCAGGNPFPICRDWHDVEYDDVPGGSVVAIADAVIEYRAGLWVHLAQRQKLVKAATTVGQIQAIEW